MPVRLRYAAVMLSVLIETMNDEDALARTLASLVGGAVEGVVREVIVCDRGSTDHTELVADHAGCLWLAQSDIGEGVRRARGEWLLVLEPGARLEAGWTECVIGHTADTTGPARFSRARTGPRFLSRLFSARRPLADGLVITRRQAAALLRDGAGASALAARFGVRRLSAEIAVTPRR